MSRLLPHARYEELKVVAADTIEDYGLVYPLEPLEIAVDFGVRVVIHREWHPVIETLCASQDGFTVAVEGPSGPGFMTHINGTMAPMRQRFTLMHELSHVLVDHLLRRGKVPPEIAEAEANFLAAYLLAPDVLIARWVPDRTRMGIAAVFMLSDEAAHLAHQRYMRAVNLGAVSAEHDERIAAAATRRLAPCPSGDSGARGSA